MVSPSPSNRFSDIDCSFTRLPPIYAYHMEKLVSLEKALEPVQSQIPGLADYIKKAKERCRYPSEHGLTHDESASIYIYTMEWGNQALYRVLNTALRDVYRSTLNAWFPYLKLFDTALEKLPTVQGILWRGVSKNVGKDFARNQIVTWWSVNSCSSSLDIVKRFLGNESRSTLFLIEALTGKQVSGYTEYQNEDEVILKMGTQLRVKTNALDQPNGSFIVHLIESDERLYDTPSFTTPPAVTPPIKSGSSPPYGSWKQQAVTVAGGNGQGSRLDQLYNPHGIFVDAHKTIYVADWFNHRIVRWQCDAKEGEIIAGGNESGNRSDQLKLPTDVTIDQRTGSLIVADAGNMRVMKCPDQSSTHQTILLENIRCYGLTIAKNGCIYVSDSRKNDVRRWREGETEAMLVAGGDGHSDQLSCPTYLFIDNDESLYVSDTHHHRVLKWSKGASEGVVVAGGNGQGNALNQLRKPQGVFVDRWHRLFVADSGNDRVVCWCKGSTTGSVVVGTNQWGKEVSPLWYPVGLTFDADGNLYVADCYNHRVRKFEVIPSRRCAIQ